MEGARKQLVPPGPNGLRCPPLLVRLPCGEVPCAADCAMNEWEDWSSCSRSCGGGVRSRERTVQVQASHGGRACPVTAEREECEVGSCDSDCELGDWGEWSPCSRACRLDAGSAPGRQLRRRGVTLVAQGSGSCPQEGDAERLLMRHCHDELCPNNTVCGGEQDIVVLVQGTDDHDSFQAQLQLIRFLVDRSTQAVHFGIVVCGSRASVLLPVTADHSAVLSALDSAELPDGSPDLAQGQAAALNLLRATGSPGESRRSQTALVLADSEPSQPLEVHTVASRIRSTGARLVVGLVDSRSQLARTEACEMASRPCDMNVATAESWGDMAQSPGKFLNAICNELVTEGAQDAGGVT